MLAILLLVILFPVTALMVSIIVGGIDTFNDWIDEKIEELKTRKESEKIKKEREELWEQYISLKM